MLRDWHRRLLYFLCAIVVMMLGLASRHYATSLPDFVSDFAGDTLWALMVVLGISVVAPNARVSHRGAIAITFAYAVEVSQLYHAPWISALRRTTLGGLVLGFGYVWTDFVCYATGVSIGMALDCIVYPKTRIDSGSRNSEEA